MVKVSRHTKSEEKKYDVPSRRFSDVHIDIVGPLYPCRGNQYLLTCIDRFSRWPEVFPLSDIKSETVCEAFYNGWICRFGSPDQIVTDRGRQFLSHIFKDLANFIGAKHKTSTSYHPQTNGVIERFHRTLKAAVTCHFKNTWIESLPSVLLGLRIAVKSDSEHSPAEFLYGESLQIPGEFLVSSTKNENLADFVNNLKQTISKMKTPAFRRRSSVKIFVPKDLMTCKHVWIRVGKKKPLANKYHGPYKVIRIGLRNILKLKRNAIRLKKFPSIT